MPEELNRIVTDAVSDRLFASEPSRVANLEARRDRRATHLPGRQRDDRHAAGQPRTGPRRPRVGAIRPASRGEFALATLHRPSNVDVRENLVSILAADRIRRRKRLPVLLPLHPRTRKRIDEFGLAASIAAAACGSSSRWAISTRFR